MSALTGTSTLLRLALRRDRIRITLWILALGPGTVVLALALAGVYPTEAERQAAMVTVNSPAGLAFTGPAHYFTDYTLGSIVSHQLLGFTAIFAGIMSVLLVVRHSRAEEETGRAELVRAGVVGRYAHLASALAVAVIANLALALTLAILLPLTGLDTITWSGSALYGAAHAGVGITFAGLAAITAQLTESSRGANGLGMAGVGAAYLVRAAGDAADSGLSWLSPIGWAQHTFPYLDDVWWPLLLHVATFVACAAAGMALSVRRDVGSGMRAPRRGRPTASAALRTPIGFAFRLHRGMLIGFAIGMALLGMSYGPFLGDIETQFRDISIIDEALTAIGGSTLIDAFLAMLLSIMATVAAVYVVMAVFRARSEETSGRGEQVLGTWQSRTTFLSAHVLIAMIGGPLILLLMAALLGITGQPTVEEPVIVKTLVTALIHIPALWVFGGLAAAMVGWAPRATSLVWVSVAYAGLVGYLGPLLQLPSWTARLSPFGWVPGYPAEDLTLLPLIGLALVAAALIALGLAGFRHRDLDTT